MVLRCLSAFLFSAVMSALPANAESPQVRKDIDSHDSFPSRSESFMEHLQRHTAPSSKGLRYRLEVGEKEIPTYFEIEGPLNGNGRAGFKLGLRF